MLWLAFRFPSLPLEIFTRGGKLTGPLAAAASPAVHAAIVACNQQARHLGIHEGIAVAAARALSSGLRVFTRDSAEEHTALERVASWALQFSPAVSIAEPAEVLLEVEGSLSLFGGLSRLWAEVTQKISTMGYTAVVGAAPTPLAAQWFARADLPSRIRHDDALRLSLERLPVSVVGLSPASEEILRNIGVTTLGECLQQPRDGLARRAGKELFEQLDRALGRIPDPRPTFVTPRNFNASLPLPAPVEQADALLFAAHHLLLELCGWLAATAQGVQSLGLALSHEGHDETRFTLSLSEASRDPTHLTNVLRERLKRLTLPRPAHTLAMQSGRVLPLASRNLSFLPDTREEVETIAQLIERLRARLGEEAVQGFDTIADYRPERAWRACEPGKESTVSAGLPASARPLWLLPAPRPLLEIADIPHYEGPLTLLTLPERIEAGWWDGNDVVREYYVACNPARSLLWIYRQSHEKSGWYLHGFFS
jgi:protein ImuB